MINANSIFKNKSVKKDENFSSLPEEIKKEIFRFLNNKELMTKVRMLSQDYKTFIESSIFNHNKNMLEGFKKLELESLLFLERKLSPKRKMFPSIKLKLKKCLAI
ncbi:MAG: hypothetical protein LEGION0398_MBIBDBAK_01001 [Legionellaceae bacterium]